MLVSSLAMYVMAFRVPTVSSNASTYKAIEIANSDDV